MITSSGQRIEALTSAGSWGVDTLHGLLASHAANRPNHLAVKDQPNREELTGDLPLALTWAELEHASEALAIQLQQLGVGVDDTLIVQLPNVVELLVTYYAASKIGAILSPVPVQYGSHELQLVNAALNATALITIEHFLDTGLAAAAQLALPGTRILIFGRDLQIATGKPKQCCEPHDAENANSVISICWTSGTTGTPKGVPRSHNMWLATANRNPRSTAAQSPG